MSRHVSRQKQGVPAGPVAGDQSPRHVTWSLDCAAAVLVVAALITALLMVRGLQWPFADDHFRDLAQAQTALDGAPLADPYYAGERLWYNPLVPWVIALGSWAAGVPPASFHVYAGPWLNLLGPIAFYLVARRIAGAGAAVAALLFFLFVNGSTGWSRDHATYSPWLFVANFAQGLFYVGVLALLRVRERPSLGWVLVIGMVGGLAFLAHTGAALLLALLTVVTLRWYDTLRAGITAAIIASPFLYIILFHYGMRIVNPAPMAGGPWLTASAVRLPELVVTNAALLVLGGVGLLVVRNRLLQTWLAAAVALTMWGLLSDLFPMLPRIVPTLHFWRYAGAALTVYAGAFLWWAVHRAVGERTAMVVTVGALVTAAAVFPTYLERPDFWGRDLALGRGGDDVALTADLRMMARGDVVLAPLRTSLEVAGPAGARVVAVDRIFSNPYVDADARIRDHQEMFEDLRTGAAVRFRERADRHRVGYVIAPRDDCRALSTGPLELTKTYEEACLFRVLR